MESNKPEIKTVDVVKNKQEKLDINIRLATPADWEVFRDLRLEALSSNDQKMFIGDYPEFADRENNMTEDEWKKELANKDIFGVLTFAGTKPIGSASVWKNNEQPGTYGMSRGYINENFQGGGAGKKQLAFRLREIINRGGTRVIHGIYKDNAKMLELSNSFGFKDVTGEIREYGFYQRELNDLKNPELLKKIDEILNS
jgi:RimJ/RimL family protein N-acetyltransferase